MWWHETCNCVCMQAPAAGTGANVDTGTNGAKELEELKAKIAGHEVELQALKVVNDRCIADSELCGA